MSMTPSGVLQIWERHAGELAKRWRSKFLADFRVKELCRHDEAVLEVAAENAVRVRSGKHELKLNDWLERVREADRPAAQALAVERAQWEKERDGRRARRARQASPTDDQQLRAADPPRFNGPRKPWEPM